MLMIARINNDQFPATQEICLNDFWDDFLFSYEDVIEVKDLNVQKYYLGKLMLNLHPQLAEILISNVLSNAIRYNVRNGYIMVEVMDTETVISNSYGNSIPKGDLFARFTRSVQEREATGLGLTMVKSICEKNGLEVQVEIKPEIFRLRIRKTGIET